MLPFAATCAILIALIALYVCPARETEARRLPADGAKEKTTC